MLTVDLNDYFDGLINDDGPGFPSGETCFLSFTMSEGSDEVTIDRSLDQDVVDAHQLANFFSCAARAAGFEITGVAIYMGDTIHASDY